MSSYAIDSRTEEVPLYPDAAPAKSVPVAVLLSFLWPGLGHFYAGAPIPGVAFTILCLVTFGFMGRITSAVNAAMTVARLNRANGASDG